MAKITLDIYDALLDRLNKALEFQGETLDQAFSEFADGYIEATYLKVQAYYDELRGAIARESDVKLSVHHSSENEPKCVRRVPAWARKPNQYNHRIIKAFFQLENERGVVRLRELEQRCHDLEHHPEVYVPTFSSNFAQMKFDEGNSHGKIFEESYGTVTLWEKAKAVLDEHKHFFK
jgi:pterin-4a-carbinolamine dehydratase